MINVDRGDTTTLDSIEELWINRLLNALNVNVKLGETYFTASINPIGWRPTASLRTFKGPNHTEKLNLSAIKFKPLSEPGRLLLCLKEISLFRLRLGCPRSWNAVDGLDRIHRCLRFGQPGKCASAHLIVTLLQLHTGSLSSPSLGTAMTMKTTMHHGI